MKFVNKAFCAFVLVAAFCHISLVAPAAANEAAQWSVASVTGTAQTMAAKGEWRALNKGAGVGVGHRVRTGGDGHVVLSRDDETVTIGSGSSFEMQAASNGMLTKIFQKVGTLMFKVHKRPSKHFQVQTPYLVAAVKGTTFTVSVDDAGGAVHVIEGLVEVGDLGGADKVLVHPGKTANVAAERGSKVQIGVTPATRGKSKSSGGKQSKAPKINRKLGAASLDVERSSNGLFKSSNNPGRSQMASVKANSVKANSASDGNGNAFGKDKSLAASLGNGLGLGLGNGNGSGNGNGNSGGNSNAGGNGNGNAYAYGQGNGNGNGNSNAGGNGKGKK